jgi:hypothetical protein
MKFRFLLVISALAMVPRLGAQDQPEEVVRLTIHPAPAPVPALKYQFLPEFRDQVTGNALIHYHRAALMIGKMPGPDDAYWKWIEMPPKELPREQVQKFLQKYHNLFRELELAARCDRCDWQFRERMKTDGFGLLLPDVQQLREFANLLRVQAGLEIAEGRFKDAVKSLRVGFAMAKHCNESPTLIAALVAVAIANHMADELNELIQASGAPNLYWAITDLPRPFIDLHLGMQSERMIVNGIFASLAQVGIDIRTTPLSPQQLQVVVDGVGQMLDVGGGRHVSEAEQTGTRLALIGIAIKGYPEAKQYLLSQGVSAEIVEAMPRLQVVLIFALAEYDRLFDEMIKWQGIPYWQARAGLEKADRAVREDRAKASELGRIPVASMLIPAVQRVFFATAKVDRKLAALRCVEAIRLYAATHEGKLPATLSDITEVPVPIDPVTGKEFEYKMEDGKEILYGPPPSGEKPGYQNYLKFELTLAK